MTRGSVTLNCPCGSKLITDNEPDAAETLVANAWYKEHVNHMLADGRRGITKAGLGILTTWILAIAFALACWYGIYLLVVLLIHKLYLTN